MNGFSVRKKVSFRKGPRSRKMLRAGAEEPAAQAPARIPRVSRLVALALQVQQMVDDGTIPSYAVAAELGHITPARMTQIMNLLFLAPDIIEDVLFLPRIEHGRDPITERDLRPLTIQLDWRKQRTAWRTLREERLPAVGHDVPPCREEEDEAP